MTMMIPIVLISSLLFTRQVHPLSMGLILLIQTINVSLITGISTYSFWFSYIFFFFFPSSYVGFIYLCFLFGFQRTFFFFYHELSFFMLIFGASLIVLMMFDFTSVLTTLSIPSSSVNEIYSTSVIISWIYSKNFHLKVNFNLTLETVSLLSDHSYQFSIK